MAKGDSSGQAGGSGYFPGVYQATAAQTGNDYDSIMSQYQNLASQYNANNPGQNTQLQFSPLTPQVAQYTPGSNHQNLRDMEKTGGYSEGDINNIRSRATSPIKSIYSSGQQNLQRQKALSGGYSPNSAAASAKMARESSGLISRATTDANANIAEMVQRGKMGASMALAPLDARENEFHNNFNANNAGVVNSTNQFNAQMPLAYQQSNNSASNNSFNNILSTIQGQQSLYGTTPGLQSTFGNQALSAANIANGFAPVQRGSMSSGNNGFNSMMRNNRSPFGPMASAGASRIR